MMPIRSPLSILAGLIGTVLLGCAVAPPVEERTHLAAKPVCCESFRTLPFDGLTAAAPRHVEVSTASSVMVVGASKSYVVGFALSSSAHPARALAVRSDVLGSAFSAKTTFCPSVILLNEQLEQIAFADVPMSTRDTLLGPDQFSGELPIPLAARYIVLYTSRAFGGSSASFSPLSPGYTALVGGNPGWGRPVGSAVGSLPCSPTGRVHVSLIPR